MVSKRAFVDEFVYLLKKKKLCKSKTPAITRGFGVLGNVYKPDFVPRRSASMTICLGLTLPQGSSELPNLLLHQQGFTTPSCHHEARCVAE